MDTLQKIVLGLCASAVAVQLFLNMPEKQIIPDYSKPLPVITSIDENCELIKRDSVSQNWIKIFTTPGNLRLVVDERTMNIIDTMDVDKNPVVDKKNITKYFDKHPDLRKPCTTYKGMLEFMQGAFFRFSLYEDIIKQTFENDSASGLPYITTFESGVRPRVASNLKSDPAIGLWQFRIGSKGKLIINKDIDERNAILPSTSETVDKTRGSNYIFQSTSIAAVTFNKGEFGTTRSLEDALDLSKKLTLFNSYGDMVRFHVPNKLKKYSFEKAIEKLQGNKPTIWSNYLKEANNNSDSAKVLLFNQYIKETTPKRCPGVHELRSVDASKYILTFSEYYEINKTPEELYDILYDYLIDKNKSEASQYAREMRAAMELYNHPREHGFSYTKQDPIQIDAYVIKRGGSYVDVFKKLSPLTKDLNAHIKDWKNIPKNTKMYLRSRRSLNY